MIPPANNSAPTLRFRFGSLAFLLGTLPPFPGKLRLVDFMARIARLQGSPACACSPFPGVQFFVDLADRIQRQMWAGCYEQHVTRCLQTLLRPGDTFLDVGANIGYHSLFAARFVHPTGRVFAFEADPGLFLLLHRNLQQFPQSRMVHCAVCDRDGEVMFERSSTPGESGWGTMTAARDLGAGEHVSVPAISLDHWALQNPLASLRAIKMDIEGSELAMLRGSRKLLKQFRPVLLLEINDVHLRRCASSAELLGKDLLALRYRIFQLSYRRISPMDSLANCSFADCLCVPEEATADILERLRKHGFHA